MPTTHKEDTVSKITIVTVGDDFYPGEHLFVGTIQSGEVEVEVRNIDAYELEPYDCATVEELDEREAEIRATIEFVEQLPEGPNPLRNDLLGDLEYVLGEFPSLRAALEANPEVPLATLVAAEYDSPYDGTEW
jgi:hypothetical protein